MWENKIGPKPPLEPKPVEFSKWFPSGSKPDSYHMGAEAEAREAAKASTALIASQKEKIDGLWRYLMPPNTAANAFECRQKFELKT
jgi:hypothetical protein